MLIRPILLSLLVLLPASVAVGQTMIERATSAADGSLNTTGTFRDETVTGVVIPFETAAPAETGLSHTGFEERIGETRNADTDQGRVLRATEEAAQIRPDVRIDGQGALFEDANWAHQNADAIAGRYFSGESGSCTTPDLPVSDLRDAFCESQPAIEEKTCNLTRQITVDRTDTYRCDIRSDNFVQVCERRRSYLCEVETTPEACIQNAVEITGGAVTWEANRATVHLPAPANPQKPDTGVYRQNWAALVKHPVSIAISDRFQPDEVAIRAIDSHGVLQITQGGTPLVTYADSRITAFSNPAQNWHGGACPQNDRDGLLVAYTNTKQNTHPAQLHITKALIMKKPPAWSYWAATWWVYPRAGGPTVFESGYDVEDGIGPFYTAVGFEFWDACYDFAALGANAHIQRDTLTFLDLDTHAAARPEGPPRALQNELTARVVYETDTPEGGAASLTFEFSGACCDGFRDTGAEVCE